MVWFFLMPRYTRSSRKIVQAPPLDAKIVARQDKEEKPEIRDGYVLFWGSWPSNFWASPFVLDGVRWNCVEQWMHAEKARLFRDEETRDKIIASPYPMSQKDLGRQVRGYRDAVWKKKRYGVVLRGIVEKFRQNPRLRKLLLGTGSAKFVECSPEDEVWGIGLKQSDPRATDPSKWRGENLLGKALTAARAKLKK